MKKILILLFILSLGIFTYAQDIDYSMPEFSTFPPAGWTTIDDNGSTGTSINWEQINYALVLGDEANLQSEWIISPTITTTLTYSYRVSFDYWVGDDDGNSTLNMLVSDDDGATWDLVADNAWSVGAGANWNHVPTFIIDAFFVAGTDNIKIAFVCYNAATASTTDFGLDNILIEDDGGAATWATNKYQSFENGLTSGSWTTIVDDDGNGTLEHWSDHYIAGVLADDTDNQDEWFISPEISLPDIEHTTVSVDLSWYAYTNDNTFVGAELLVSTDNGTTWDPTVYSITYNNILTDQIYFATVDISAYIGEDILVAIRHQTSPPGNQADFFLEGFYLYQTFDEVTAQGDAENIDFSGLSALESLLYPSNSKYNADIAEGFWLVPPDGWTVTPDTNTMGAATITTWQKDAAVNGHAFAAHIDSVNTDGAAQDETLTSETMTIAYPSVGAAYELSFQWRTETSLNCGTNTDPLLGDVNFADIIMEIRFNTGIWSEWTEIWAEDDEAVLEETASPWTDWDAYMAGEGNWYTANINISGYIDATTTDIEVRFNYSNTIGNDGIGGYFSLDNFYILETRNPEFELEAAQPFTFSDDFLHNYTKIPVTQLNNPYNLGAFITNYGISTFDDDNLFVDVNGTIFGYKTVTDAAFTSYPSTEYFEMDNISTSFPNGLELEEDPVSLPATYALDYYYDDLNGSGLVTESTSFDVTEQLFRKHDGTNPNDFGDDGITGGLGIMFEFQNDDVIDKVEVELDNANTGSEFNMSIIKIADPNASSGTLVYTSPLLAIDNFSTHIFNEDIAIEAGYYVFMFNQLDNNSLEIQADDEGEIVRGNAGNLYINDESVETGDLWVDITVKPNNAPVIATSFTGDEQILVADEAISLEFEASDDDDDALIWTLTDTTPTWLVDWITFTDNGDGTATLSGTPLTSHLGKSTVIIEVDDGRGGTDTYTFNIEVISQVANVIPDYTEGFLNIVPINWSILKDQNNDGVTSHWAIDAGNDWMYVNDQNGVLQNEWFISPPIYLEEDGDFDSTYVLSFDWKVEDFDDFCLGISGQLGSGVNNDGNFADVKVWISIDDGLTWSDKIWQEDDENLVAPVTDGILGGERWGYTDNTWYTSEIDLTADYAGQTIMVAFQYLSQNAAFQNKFYLDDFEVLRNSNVDISVFAYRKYDRIPESQVDQSGGHYFDAYIINNGITVPEGATYTINLPEISYYSTVSLTNADFATSDTLIVSLNYFPPANVNETYNFTIIVDATGNVPTGLATHTESTTIDADDLYKEHSNTYEENSFGYYDGLGSIFELTNADHLQNIYAYFGASAGNAAPFSISLIKLNAVDDASGELIATFDDNGGTQLTTSANNGYYLWPTNDQDFDDNIYLQPGIYCVMYNQLDDAKPLYITRSDFDFDFNEFVRGNFTTLYSDPYDKGKLAMRMRFIDNVAPEFVDDNGATITTLSVNVLEGEGGSFMILASDDDDFDILGFEQVTEPSFMAPAWLSFTPAGNDTITMTIANTATAGTYPAQLMVGDGIDTTTLDISIFVNGPQFMSDEFHESFNPAWVITYPELDVDNIWTLYAGINNESTEEFYDDGNIAAIDDDNADYQDRWLISPYVYFSAPSNDTTYWLHFSWYIDDISVMLGGTQGTLGSGNEFDDYNYADLRVKISNDGGNTWTTIWQEDDEALVMAASPDIDYPYDETEYDASIDITAYAGQSLLFGFQYEGLGGSYIYLDDIEVERVDPYVDLEIVGFDPVEYGSTPLNQTKTYDIKAIIRNNGTTASLPTILSAEVTFGGASLVPAYEESLTVPAINAGDTDTVTYSQLTPDQCWDNYSIAFDSDIPYNLAETYSFYVDDEYYYYPNGTNNGVVTNQVVGEGLGQIFEIVNSDVLTTVEFETSDATNTDYLIKIVELASEAATSGTLVYTSNELNKPGPGTNFYTYDIDDVYLTAGFYAVMLHPAVEGGAFNVYYDIETDGSFIRGDASGFAVDEDDAEAYLNLRLLFNKQTPDFDAQTVDDEDAIAGLVFSKTVRVIDDDEYDVITFNYSELPSWITPTDNLNRTVTFTGTPTSSDMGGNTIIVSASDATYEVSQTIVITVLENPAPEFTSAPGFVGTEGVAYSYSATASDLYGDVVTITASTLPAWLSTTGTNPLVVSGTPLTANVGDNVVKLLATDANGMTSQQIFNIYVIENAVPEFLSWPVEVGYEGIEYIYNVSATDANSDNVLTLIAPTLPAGLTFTDNGGGSGTLSGIPTTVGNNAVVLDVADNLGASAQQSFTIVVEAANVAPTFTSTGITTATEDVMYQYSVTATDADGDYMYFETPKKPSWLIFTTTGNGTAKLYGTPDYYDEGANRVKIVVSDGEGFTTQSFTITVNAANDPPEFKSTGILIATVEEIYNYEITVFDEEGDDLEFNAILPEWLQLNNNFDGSALLSGIPSSGDIGTLNMSITVDDGELFADQTFDINVVEKSTSFSSDDNDELFSMYPNPSKGMINISNRKSAEVFVYDIFGKLHKQHLVISDEEPIDISSLAQGTYIVKILFESEITSHRISLIK